MISIKIHSRIQIITKFLNELKTIEDTLLQQSTQSLIEICKHVAIDNLILNWIPERIKCENYVAINIHLIRTRSFLQERKINIEEKQIKLWNENFHSYEQQNKQENNRFYQYLNVEDKEQDIEESKDWTIPSTNIDGLNNENNLHDETQFSQKDQMESDEHSIEYSSLMELNIRLVPYTSSKLIEQIQQ